MRARRVRTSSSRSAWALALLWPLAASACTRSEPGIGPEPAPVVTGAPGCPGGLPGPGLVLVPGPDQSGYCIDVRETTRAEYEEFLDKKAGDTSGQPAECAWNDSYMPAIWDPASGEEPPPDSVYYCRRDEWERPADAAVGCVDFCDALAYCESAGKRLCGRVGGPQRWGRVYVGWDANSQSVSEWDAFTRVITSVESELFNACTGGGMTRYPYGDVYESGRCIDPAWVDAGGSLDVASTAERDCNGVAPPYDQIYDLSGSVQEWQNFCRLSLGSSVPGCAKVDSSYEYELVACDQYGVSFSKAVAPNMGFRCCADSVLVR